MKLTVYLFSPMLDPIASPTSVKVTPGEKMTLEVDGYPVIKPFFYPFILMDNSNDENWPLFVNKQLFGGLH